MAESPKKVPQRLNKDVREVIKEMSKAPFGTPGKVNKTPMLTVAETEEIKAKAKVPPILEIKKEPLKLTPKQKEARIKEISKERGISYSKAKEVLRKELATAPKSTAVKQPEITLAKAIPTRQEVEDVSTRAVKYKGKTIYLTPGQIKQLGLPVDYPETTFGNLFGEDKAQAKKAEDLLNREIKDVKSIKESNMLREEAAKDWSNQARAAATNPQVRDPLEALGKATPDSAKAESYAERLYQKAYKELSSQERKRIKIIIEEDARRAAKATQSTVGRKMDVKGIKRGSYVPPFIKSPGGLGALGFVGFAANAFFSYKLMLQEAEQENKNLREQAMN